jgi:hypothetical protein
MMRSSRTGPLPAGASGGFGRKCIAEQLTRLQKWRAILSRAFKAFLKGRLLRPLPRLAPSRRNQGVQNRRTPLRQFKEFRVQSALHRRAPRILLICCEHNKFR